MTALEVWEWQRSVAVYANNENALKFLYQRSASRFAWKALANPSRLTLEHFY